MRHEQAQPIPSARQADYWQNVHPSPQQLRRVERALRAMLAGAQPGRGDEASHVGPRLRRPRGVRGTEGAMSSVAALFVRADSIYKRMPGVDAWDAERDARTWPGGSPVVAHPPCRAWGAFAWRARPRDGERECAPWAVEQIRMHGGVLEHPAASRLWPEHGLPEPCQRDAWGVVDTSGRSALVGPSSQQADAPIHRRVRAAPDSRHADCFGRADACHRRCRPSESRHQAAGDQQSRARGHAARIRGLAGRFGDEVRAMTCPLRNGPHTLSRCPRWRCWCRR